MKTKIVKTSENSPHVNKLKESYTKMSEVIQLLDLTIPEVIEVACKILDDCFQLTHKKVREDVYQAVITMLEKYKEYWPKDDEQI